jgi:hypothetical protein
MTSQSISVESAEKVMFLKREIIPIKATKILEYE